MARFRLLPAAIADLAEIRDYIDEHNAAAAAALLDRIENRCGFFAQHPNAGRDRSEVRPRLRSFVVGRYVAFYRLADNGIEIVRVLHGARDIDEILR